MLKSWRWLSCCCAGTLFSLLALAEEPHSGQEPRSASADLYRYVRLYTGADEETHFEDVVVTFTYKDYGKKIPTVWFPDMGVIAAEGFHFVSMPAGWEGGDWHPAPRRQFIIPLAGHMEFQTSDGEKRRFGPGEVLLVEDTAGKGHISHMASPGMGIFAVVPLPDQDTSD